MHRFFRYFFFIFIGFLFFIMTFSFLFHTGLHFLNYYVVNPEPIQMIALVFIAVFLPISLISLVIYVELLHKHIYKLELQLLRLSPTDQ